MILLFLVTLVVVFNALATVSMLLKAAHTDKLFPPPYSVDKHTRLKSSLAAISLE